MTGPASRPDREVVRELPVRPEDRPLFYLLLALNLAVLVALPLAAWSFQGWARWYATRVPRLGWLGPAAIAGAAVAEVVLFQRLRRLWRRLRPRP